MLRGPTTSAPALRRALGDRLDCRPFKRASFATPQQQQQQREQRRGAARLAAEWLRRKGRPGPRGRSSQPFPVRSQLSERGHAAQRSSARGDG